MIFAAACTSAGDRAADDVREFLADLDGSGPLEVVGPSGTPA